MIQRFVNILSGALFCVATILGGFFSVYGNIDVGTVLRMKSPILPNVQGKKVVIISIENTKNAYVSDLATKDSLLFNYKKLCLSDWCKDKNIFLSPQELDLFTLKGPFPAKYEGLFFRVSLLDNICSNFGDDITIKLSLIERIFIVSPWWVEITKKQLNLTSLWCKKNGD